MKKILAMVAGLTVAVSAWAGNVNGSISLSLGLSHTATNGISAASESLPSLISQAFSTGVTTNKMNHIYYTENTLAAGASNYLDIVGGLTDSFGQTANFARLRFMAVVANSTNIGDIGVGGPAPNGATRFFGSSNDCVRIPPGGIMFWYCPTANAYSNTAGTADILEMTNFSASVSTYKIYLGGSTLQ